MKTLADFREGGGRHARKRNPPFHRFARRTSVKGDAIQKQRREKEGKGSDVLEFTSIFKRPDYLRAAISTGRKRGGKKWGSRKNPHRS